MIQIARALGGEVTAVCSTSKLELARSLGADYVIDYTTEDFADQGRHYDIILGVNGYRPLSVYKRALAPRGRYLMCGGDNKQLFQGMLLAPLKSIGSNKKLGIASTKTNSPDLDTLRELLEAGRIRPVLDRVYPLEETAAAFHYLEEGHATGKIVITVAHNT